MFLANTIGANAKPGMTFRNFSTTADVTVSERWPRADLNWCVLKMTPIYQMSFEQAWADLYFSAHAIAWYSTVDHLLDRALKNRGRRIPWPL
jgi:hypothetical protein